MHRWPCRGNSSYHAPTGAGEAGSLPSLPPALFRGAPCKIPHPGGGVAPAGPLRPLSQGLPLRTLPQTTIPRASPKSLLLRSPLGSSFCPQPSSLRPRPLPSPRPPLLWLSLSPSLLPPSPQSPAPGVPLRPLSLGSL